MSAPIALILALFAVTEARVTFPTSEVLQANDIVNNVAAFTCDDGCKVYVDGWNDNLTITQNGNFIANFTEISGEKPYNPAGLELPAGKNYKVQAEGSFTNFVLWAVSTKAPNYGLSIGATEGTTSIKFVGSGRYATIISSFNVLEYHSFSGTFPAGYPKIYTTGYDSVGDTRCRPVFEGRSQYNVEQSRPVIMAPIVTVDFGYSGSHSMEAIQGDGTNPFYKNSLSSAVYMSPGYVGCTSTGGQQYYSNLKGTSDAFTLAANSLDINAVYTSVDKTEPVKLKVNNDILDFYGTSTAWSHEYNSSTFNIQLSWTRKTPASSWAMQMDLGAGTFAPSSSTPRTISTTSSGSALVYFASLIGVVLMALFQ